MNDLDEAIIKALDRLCEDKIKLRIDHHFHFHNALTIKLEQPKALGAIVSFQAVPKGNISMPYTPTCSTLEKLLGTLTPTAGGQPAPVEPGSLVVEVLGGEGTFAVTGDLTYELISPDNPGVTNYRVTVDADPGSGLQPLSILVDATYTHPLADSMGTTFTAVPK